MIIETGSRVEFKHIVLDTVRVWHCTYCGAGFTIPATWMEWYDLNIDDHDIRWCPRCWADYRNEIRNQQREEWMPVECQWLPAA